MLSVSNYSEIMLSIFSSGLDCMCLLAASEVTISISICIQILNAAFRSFQPNVGTSLGKVD